MIDWLEYVCLGVGCVGTALACVANYRIKKVNTLPVISAVAAAQPVPATSASVPATPARIVLHDRIKEAVGTDENGNPNDWRALYKERVEAAHKAR